MPHNTVRELRSFKLKIQLIDINKKKEAQVLQDISFTPAERFVRMFDLIEFCIAFSVFPKVPLGKENFNVVVLKKKTKWQVSPSGYYPTLLFKFDTELPCTLNGYLNVQLLGSTY